MQNISCEVVQDLLALYHDGVCSEESSRLICSHIRSCEKCREELNAMDFSIDLPGRGEEVNAAAAAFKAWRRNKRRAFRGGLILAMFLVLATATVFIGTHYVFSSRADDGDGLVRQLEKLSEVENIAIDKQAQKGDYLALSGCDDKGLWYLGIYKRDRIFADRWRLCGDLERVKAGKLANWNYKTPEGDTVLVCYGATLPDEVRGYTFTNSGVTYTCTVKDNTVLDFFFIPDSYDSKTYLEPICQP